jgi:methionyl-tRNA formyltransferase
MTPIAFLGSPDFAVPILEALVKNFDLRVVITQPAQMVGKHRQLQSTAIGRLAESLGIPVLTPTKLRDPEFRAILKTYQVNLGIVAAYGRILPDWMLDWPTKGMINVHGSLLPAYRGASPISAAILDGLTSTGITFMFMNAGMDEGDILTKIELPISPDDTKDSLSQKLSQLASHHIASVAQHYLADQLTAQPQALPASYTQPLQKDDGQVDVNQLPLDLERRIRAYSAWPGVWLVWKGKRIKLLPHQMVQLEGKRPVSLTDFLLGHPDFPLKIIS